MASKPQEPKYVIETIFDLITIAYAAIDKHTLNRIDHEERIQKLEERVNKHGKRLDDLERRMTWNNDSLETIKFLLVEKGSEEQKPLTLEEENDLSYSQLTVSEKEKYFKQMKRKHRKECLSKK